MLRYLQSELNYWFTAYVAAVAGTEDERIALCMVVWLRGKLEHA